MLQLSPDMEQIKEMNDLNRGTLESMITKEDFNDHDTVAGVIRVKVDDKICYVIMDHIKHNMLTFPIGKCKPGLPIQDELRREMKEEIGVDVKNAGEAVSFNKVYSFTGKPVNVNTHVFNIYAAEGEVKNMEPDKCRGIRLLIEEEILNSGRRIGDCVRMYFDMLKIKRESN